MFNEFRTLKLRLYQGKDDDLLAWLETLPEARFGELSLVAKEALRRGLGLTTSPVETLPPPSSSANFLPEIRQVVEAAVQNALQGMQFASTPRSLQETTPDDSAEALLDLLGEALLLDEEEEA